MTAPTAAEDAEWMNKTLSARAARISVHDVAAPADEADKEESTAQTLKIDWGAVGQ